MSEVYLPYHRKHRPKNLMQYAGAEKIKKGLMSALRGNHRPQVILLTGTSGGGKTSLARLISKEYMCENRDEIIGACGECYNCKLIEDYIETGNAGALINLREVDVTDSNKKEDITEILEDASRPAYDGSWKIYILDECHMMTVSAQNRLLKNLEEPVEKVLMILCTTDPEKLLPTIITRCQYPFKVTKPSRDELGNMLARVCEKEGVDYEPKALSLVCVKGEFIFRKSLILLEQVVREKGSVTYENALEVLNEVDDKHFFEFFNLLIQEPINIFKYITFLGKLKEKVDLKTFMETLIAFSVRGIYISNGVVVEALDKSEIDRYRKIFTYFSPGDIAYMLTKFMQIKGSKDIEAELLLLGYTGLRKNIKEVEDTSKDDLKLVDISGITPMQEKREGDENYLDSIKVTDEEKESFIKDNSKVVDIEDIAKMFNCTKINLE